MLSLCVVLPMGAPAPPWVPGSTNGSLLFSSSEPPLHFFDWGPAAARGCDWAYFAMEETFADYEVLWRRLSCVGGEQPRVLGRLSDRHQTRYPIHKGRPLPTPRLGLGLAVSSGALRALAGNVAGACSDLEFAVLSGYTASHPMWQGAEADVPSFAAALCLSNAQVPPAEPLGHEEEHFVLGDAAAERVLVRRAIGGASYFRGARPCLLAAYPVSWRDQAVLAGAGIGRCSAAAAEHLSTASIEMGSAGVVPQPGSLKFHQVDGYAVSDVGQRMLECGEQIPPHVSHPLLPTRPSPAKNQTRLSMLVGLPGGGTTWFFEALLAGHGARAAQHSGFFHPYCHQLWRIELSHFVAATEDLSRIHLFRETVPAELFDDLVQRMLAQFLRTAEGRSPAFLSRENLNIWRVPDFVRNGFRVVGLFRHRRHTFPLSDTPGSPSWGDLLANAQGANDFKYSALCRTCFYFMMFYAPQVGNPDAMLRDRAILAMARLAAVAPPVPLARQAAAHTLFWYVMLRAARLHGYRLPLVDYERLIRCPPEELRALLRAALPLGIRAGAVADYILGTRRSSAWLAEEERRYVVAEGHAEAEAYAARMLEAIRHIDPETDVSLLD